MAKQKFHMWRVTPKYMIQNAKARGYEQTHAVSEFIDNSIDAGANNIYISKELQENGLYTLSITDDGCGMSSDLLQKAFIELGFERAYSKRSISSFGVGSKEAMGYLCEGGIVDVISAKDGKISEITISYNEKNPGVSDVTVKDYDGKNGTSIIIKNVKMTDKDHLKLMDWISFIYYPAKEQNPNLNIFFSVKLKTRETLHEIKFVDVMYRHMATYNDSAVELHFDREYPLVKETVKVKAYIFKSSEFAEKDLFSEFDRGQKQKGSFSFERAGIYWKLGARYSNFGKGNFVSMTNQHSLNNVRIEIDISGPKLMKLFKVNQNKSKITIPSKTEIEENVELKYFFDELRLIVSGMVSAIKMTNRNYNENEVNDRDRLNSFVNSAGDFTGLGQEIEDLKDVLEQGEPEVRPEIEPTGIKRNRRSGYKQHRDSYRIEYMSISPWAPFMELPKLYSNKYIYTVNTAHPYYSIFEKLTSDAQNHIVMNMVNQLSVLLHIQNETSENDFTRKFIEKNDSILKNWVESFSFKEQTTDMGLDLD